VRWLYGDPDELDRLAGLLRSRAAFVRQVTEEQVQRAQTAEWVSVSADSYRERLVRDRRAADRAAEHLEQAAAALQAHAQEIRQLVAAIHHAEEEITDWFAAKTRDLVSTVGSAVNRIVHGDLPWSGWPYTPQSLPPPGDKQWLDASRFMRRQGAL
jgi:hypothetical protein